MKLMKRHVPVELLRLLESWLSDCFTCVKWNNSWSCVLKLAQVLDRDLFCRRICLQYMSVEFYLYPTVGTVLIHSVKPELTE